MTSGGRQPTDPNEVIASFEGLVFRTSRMWAAQVNKDPEDLAQELRIRVWAAVQSFEASKAAGDDGKRTALERYVFSVITNKIKDYKRDAARAAERPVVLHIEDTPLFGARGLGTSGVDDAQGRFDNLFNYVAREQVYWLIDDRYELPPTVTQTEHQVAVLLVVGCSRDEIVVTLDMSRADVDSALRSLREKLAHLNVARSERARDRLPNQNHEQ